MIGRRDERGEWNICFPGAFTDWDWEIEAMGRFFEKLSGTRLIGEMEDKIVQDKTKKQEISIKSRYNF